MSVIDRPQAVSHPRPERIFGRLVLAAAALMGAAGVALGAAAAHLPAAGNLSIASSFLLFHAPAVLAIRALPYRSRLLGWASWSLLLGAVLFAGTLALDRLAGLKISPSPAPLGGSLLILGWCVAALGFLGSRPIR